MIDLSISEAAELLRQQKISPVDLATACLDRIERLNPVLNAFITVTREGAGDESVEHGIKTLDADRKSTRLNTSHTVRSYAAFSLKKKQSPATLPNSISLLH